jgi:hypothetical protein
MFEQPVLDRAHFMKLADTFRSPHLWKREGAVEAAAHRGRADGMGNLRIIPGWTSRAPT